MRLYQVLLLSFVILISGPTISRAVGLDIGPIVAKLTEQLTEMAKQLDEFKKISTATQDQIDAIGKVGQISLPLINATKMASQIRQDMQCLKPDLSKLMPNVEFESLDWNSVCEAGSAYRKTLWLDPDEFNALPDWDERDAALRAVKNRRKNILADATEKGLGAATILPDGIEKTNKAADELEAAANAATSENERLAVIAKSQSVIVRAIAQQNQILAQMLQIQAAFALEAGVPVERVKVELKNKKKGAEQ